MPLGSHEVLGRKDIIVLVSSVYAASNRAALLL
jgi:hypothetical protein